MNLEQQLEEIQQEYYSTKSKKSFFGKTKQKEEVAQEIINKIDLNQLLQQTAYIIEGTNHVVFDYTVFKCFAHEGIFETINQYVMELLHLVFSRFPTYILHVNLSTFTVSAAQRYLNIIIMFNESATSNIYTSKLEKLYIYNPPLVIDHIQRIIKPVIDPSVFTKIQIFTKTDSVELWKKIDLKQNNG